MNRILITLSLTFLTCVAIANNITVSNTSLNGQNTTSDFTLINFDVAWENSWRTNTNESNYDGAWIFVKYRKNGTSDWRHCTISSTGNTAASGAVFSIPSDNKGAFIYRISEGIGNVNFTGNQLQWNYGADGVLDNETAAGRLPASVYVLIDIIDQPHRAQELPCNQDFWQALQTELLPQVALLQPFTEKASRTVVAGQSFGGLASLYAGLHWPQRFGCVLSQSGSFWWPDVDNLKVLTAGTAKCRGWLTEQVYQGLGAGHPLDIFMEAGRRENVIYQVNEAMSEALRQAGHRLHYRIYAGGHDALCWRGGFG